MIVHLCEKVGESSGSWGSNRNTASSSGLPEPACMALRGRVRSLSQLSLGGVQGIGLFQWGREDKWREDKSLQPKHTTNYKNRKTKKYRNVSSWVRKKNVCFLFQVCITWKLWQKATLYFQHYLFTWIQDLIKADHGQSVWSHFVQGYILNTSNYLKSNYKHSCTTALWDTLPDRLRPVSAQSRRPLERCAFSSCVSKRRGGQEARGLSASPMVLGPTSSAELFEAQLTGLQI